MIARCGDGEMETADRRVAGRRRSMTVHADVSGGQSNQSAGRRRRRRRRRRLFLRISIAVAAGVCGGWRGRGFDFGGADDVACARRPDRDRDRDGGDLPVSPAGLGRKVAPDRGRPSRPRCRSYGHRRLRRLHLAS